MEMANGFGIMDKSMRANGDQEQRMGMVFGNLPRVTHMKENGF